MAGMETATGLNRLTAFQTTALLGLLTRVAPKRPHEEVRARVSELLEILEVCRRVAHAVEREWSTGDGQQRRKTYRSCRYSPKHFRMIHEALLALHSKTVVIRRADAKHQGQVTERVVHLLDAYGYVYERGGKELDLHDLPRGSTKVNVSSDDRPVWRIRQTTGDGERFERPAGILYRLNSELADELIHKQGTIGFTVMARKVFGLFKHYMKNPAAIRLILLILRQTGPEFLRRLDRLISDLGFDETHRRRAVEQLTGVLAGLKDARLVEAFEVSPEAEVLRVQVNRDWYQEEAASGEGG
jgi:hypothetical protein